MEEGIKWEEIVREEGEQANGSKELFGEREIIPSINNLTVGWRIF